jgi:hypothetical protein
MSDVAKVAARLSKAQREAVTAGETPGHQARYDLANQGLVDRYAWMPAYGPNEWPCYTLSLTPLGQKLANHLKEQPNAR